jgi:hypothetical protein
MVKVDILAKDMKTLVFAWDSKNFYIYDHPKKVLLLNAME